MEEEQTRTKEKNEEGIEYINLVNSNVNAMEKVSSDVSVLQDEMKKSLLDNKKNTVLLNARQSLMMLQNEYDKKYSHRDYIRRKVLGILQAGDMNTVKSSTMETIGEEALINNPDYWLAPALLALSAWYNNDKEKAQRGITEAIHRNAEMTSLLLCFIHLRANRINTATKWLNKYLDMQVPREIDSKISLIIDALTSGIFPYKMQTLVVQKIDHWLEDLNNYNEYKDIYQKQLDFWNNYIKDVKVNIEDNRYTYFEEYVKDGKAKLSFISNLNNIESINDKFEEILNKNAVIEDNYIEKIDKIITRLIFSHDDNEEELRREMFKNQCLIDTYGDDTKATEIFQKKGEFVRNYNDLYSHLTRIAINDETVYNDSKKFAMSLLGFFITTAYQDILKYDNIVNEEKKEIVFDSMTLETLDGSNEKELLDIVYKDKETIYTDYVKAYPLISFINILSCVGIVIGIVLCFKSFILGIAIILGLLGYNGYIIFERYKKQKAKRQYVDKFKKNSKIIVLNILAEIVDYHFSLEDIKEETNKFINMISNLNPQDYIKKDASNTNRNIQVGDNNG